MRECSHCHQMTDDYSSEKAHQCRPCKTELNRQYRERNRERVNQLNRKSHARNAETRRAQQREYRERRKMERQE